MLQRLLDRASKWELGPVVLAVPNEEWNEITSAVSCNGVAVYGGDATDVLARYVSAVDDCDYVLRITADCPIFDIGNALRLVGRAEQANEKYLAIDPDYGWPRGSDIELIAWDALLRANWLATNAYDREHVTSFIRAEPKLFAQYYFRHEPDVSHLRLCVDYPDDAKFLNEVWKRAERDYGEFFTIEDALSVINRRPTLAEWKHTRLEPPAHHPWAMNG